jgi:hypothetical protein
MQTVIKDGQLGGLDLRIRIGVHAGEADQIVGTKSVVELAGASSSASSLGCSVLRSTDQETELFAL